MRADLLRAPTPTTTPATPSAPQPRHSGILCCRQEGDFSHHVEALAQTILQHAEESKIATWCVVELFPLLQPFHWAAYAQTAGIPVPSQAIIDAAIIRYRQLIQYPNTQPAVK